MSVFRYQFDATDKDVEEILDTNPGIRLTKTKMKSGDTAFLGKKGSMLIFRYIWNSGEFYSDHKLSDLKYKTMFKK